MAMRIQSGVLTFLIADVRGYTKFTQSQGDEAAARLASKFAEIAREGVEAHGGEVIELRGDEALAVFSSAREALRAAVDLQLVFADELALDPSLPLRVGIGLDTGEVVPVDGGYRGAALNLAARLCSQAEAGEVLASQGVAHMARSFEGLRLRDHGRVQLKGFDEPVAVYRVASDGAGPGAPLSTLALDGAPPVRSDLPSPLDPVTPIIGRELEVRRLLWSWRMARRGNGSVLVIVGPTGIGKTRLAAEVAAVAAENGGRVAYASFAGPVANEFAVATAAEEGKPAYVVFDDVESATDIERAAVLESIARVPGSMTLAIVVYDDERASADLVAAARKLAREEDVLRPSPLELEEIRRIAALYLGAGVDSLPQGLLESSGGVPRLVHEQVAEWAHAEAARRLGTFASQADAGRSDLRAVEERLASGVADLQIVREQARLFGAEGGREISVPAESPYQGLERFDFDDADRFFGRERLVADMVARLAGAPLLAVVGSSGSGKSSALRAGLLPALVSGVLPGSERWTVVLMRPGEHPLRELDRALWTSLPSEIAGRVGSSDLPLRALRGVLGLDERIVVAIDQFEELFTLCTNEAERRAFLAALVEAATDAKRNEIVVLALRADYYGRCAVDPAFAELLSANHVLVGPMSADEYRRAIERPALGSGVRLEPALIDELVAEVLGEPGALPLLSAALLQLWELRAGRTIRAASYAETGGVRGAVARLAEAAYDTLSEDRRGLARSILLRLAAPGEADAVVGRRVALVDLDAERNSAVGEVLDVLAEHRLVTIGEGTVEVAHEALLREWPRFRDWISEDREGRRLQAHLSTAAGEWARRGRDPADLYRGVRLSTALEWTMAHESEQNELEREFIAASRAENERELIDQRRRNRRLRALLIGAVMLLIVAVISGLLARVARGHAAAAATAAVAERLGAQASTARDLDASLLLARQAVALDDTLLTRGNLEAALLRSPAAIRVYRPLPGRLNRVDISPDGRNLLFGNDSGAFAVVDSRIGRLLRTFSAQRALFGSDGRIVLAGGGMISLLDPRTGNRLVVMRGAGNANIVALARTENEAAVGVGSPGGNTLSIRLFALPSDRLVHVVLPLPGMTFTDAGFSDDGRILVVQEAGARPQPTVEQVWSVSPWRELGVIHDPRSFSTPAPGSISPGDRLLVAGHPDGSVTVYSLRTGRRADLQGRHNAQVVGAGFSRDGRTIVTTGDDAQVLSWNAASGTLSETFTGHTGRVFGPAFDPTGRTVYTAGLDGLGIAWDLSGTRRLSRPFRAASTQQIQGVRGTPVISFGMSPDGHRIAVAGLDHLGNTIDIHVIDIATGRDIATLAAAPSYLATSIAWSLDGKFVAAVGPHNDPAIWSFTPGAVQEAAARTYPLPTANSQATSLALSPDGKTIAVGASDGRVYRFDIATGAAVGRPLVDSATSLDLVFSPNGKQLASAVENVHGVGGDAFVWRASDGKLLYRVSIDDGYGFGDAVAFAPNGKLLATGGGSGVVKLRDANSGRLLGRPLRGNAGFVLSISFSPDGGQLVTGGSDGTTRIFDLATRAQLGSPLPGLDNVWVGARFTPDGKQLISYYSTGKAFAFDMAATDWEQHACSVAGRRLTRAEWAQYLPGRPYRPVC